MRDYAAVDATVELLGGRQVLKGEARTVTELDRLVRRGLPYQSLQHVVACYGTAGQAQVAQLVVPRTTMARRAREGVLSLPESERLERIARVTALASHVLDGSAAATAFLTTPHPLLDHETPLEVAVTDLGTRRVEAILERLEYSLPV